MFWRLAVPEVTVEGPVNRLQYLCPEASEPGTSIDWGCYYQGSSIFADGFESGNTSMWSSTF